MHRPQLHKRLAVTAQRLQENRFHLIARLWAEPEAPERDDRLFQMFVDASAYARNTGLYLIDLLARFPPAMADGIRQGLANHLDRAE